MFFRGSVSLCELAIELRADRNAYNGQGDQRDAHLSLLAAIALSPRTAGSLYSSKACVNYFTPGLPNRRNEPCRHRASRGACIVLSARHKEAAAMVTAATPATDSRGTGSRVRSHNVNKACKLAFLPSALVP